MIAQYENKVMSGLMLYLDNQICKHGQAFTNVIGPNNPSGASNFYPIESKYDGLWTYALPFKQIVGDASLALDGASLMTNVYVGGSLHSPGNTVPGGGTFHGILYHKGQVLFTADQTANLPISQAVSVKNYNIYITTKLEEDLLLNTKHQANPKIPQNYAGLKDEENTYPAIFLKNMGGENDPLCLGGADTVKTNVRAVILSDSAFSMDAVCNILKNTARKDLLVDFNGANTLPFNSIGAFTGVIYSYSSLVQNASSTDFTTIGEVRVMKLNPSDVKGLDTQVFPAIVDFTIHGYGRNV